MILLNTKLKLDTFLTGNLKYTNNKNNCMSERLCELRDNIKGIEEKNLTNRRKYNKFIKNCKEEKKYILYVSNMLINEKTLCLKKLIYLNDKTFKRG